MRKLVVAVALLLFFCSFCSALDIKQSFSKEEDKAFVSFMVTISKGSDSRIVETEGLCDNFSKTQFYTAFDGASCVESGNSIVITGSRLVGEGDGFYSNEGFFESDYKFNLTAASESFMTEEALVWGAVPLSATYEEIFAYGYNIDYVVEMPGEVSMVRNGFLAPDPSQAEFSLAEALYMNLVLSVESKRTNWRFFSSFIIFFVMVLGISIVWLSFFYLKGKT